MPDNISGRTRICGIIGDPVEHTMSPSMQNEAFRITGLDYVYVPFHVVKEKLAEAVRGLRSAGCAGFNVTIPHKVTVMNLLDEIDEAAACIGAVNTVVINGGRMKGYNTDGEGFLRSLGAEGVGISGRKIVVMGAGGAARAICHVLARQEAVLTILNRSAGNAAELADEINRKTGKPVASGGMENADVISGAEVLINTTSVGMGFRKAYSPLESRFLHTGLTVCDIVYNPPETELLRQAKAAGCRTVDGLGMLVWQGALSFELWTGKPAPVEAMKEAMRRRLETL